jgi:hypothetical protein
MLLALGLSACGGGGGGGGVNSTPTPPPVTQPEPPAAPTPAPAPPPSTPTVNFNDAEYQRSNAATAANALTAYNAGATGTGVEIAILDSGLSDPLGEFVGRIDSASRDMVSNRGIADPDGHGTSVAAVAAAGRNGRDILGMAFNADVLALRTDGIGTCGSKDGCTHSDTVLAQAVDYATQHGARVINMSLGGSPTGSTLRAAIGRATAAGVIIVISAGNDSTAEPDPFAQIAGSSAANGLVVIAGAHDANYVISDFSDRAGSYGQYYLTALGSRVRAFDNSGTDYLFSGTSYAAPAIAGAVALLAQAFPNLSGAQIVDLLMRTATDAGAAGTDAIYGRGILNLTRAFQPQGGTSLAGGKEQVSLSTNGTLGTAMGDAGAQAGASLGGAVILDGYSRAYALDLAATIGAAARSRPLIRAIGGNVREASMVAGGLAVSVSVERDANGQPRAALAQLGLTRDDSRQARALSGRVVARIDRRTAAAFGFSEGGKALADMLADDGPAPFLIARDPRETPGFEARRGVAIAVRHDLGPVAVTISGERGDVLGYRGEPEPGYSLSAVRFDRAWGRLRLNAGFGLMREQGSVLGARFGPALGSGGATTRMIDLGAQLRLGRDWEAGAAWRQAWTAADRGGALVDGSLQSSAFALDVEHSGASDRLGLRLAQPLRVAAGGYRLRLPTSYDYASGTVGYELRTLDLAPKGRELDAELAYGRRLGLGWIDTNFFWRREPGNIAAAPDDVGAAVRYSFVF